MSRHLIGMSRGMTHAFPVVAMLDNLQNFTGSAIPQGCKRRSHAHKEMNLH